MDKMTNVNNNNGNNDVKRVQPITSTNRIEYCVCGNKDIKVMYGGEHSRIYCELCGRQCVGGNSLNEMIDTWNMKGDR